MSPHESPPPPPQCLLDRDMLKQVHEAVMEMRGDMRMAAQRMALLEEANKEIKKTVYGNGVPGLNTRMDRIEQSTQSWNRLWRTLVAACIGLIVTGGGAAVLWIIRAMPVSH